MIFQIVTITRHQPDTSAVVLTSAWAQANTDAALKAEVASSLTVRPMVKVSDLCSRRCEPLATVAGYNMIKKGGSAIDGAVTFRKRC